MCIAGVLGGLKSGVTDTTKDVFLESAYFNPAWVRKTARRHGLNTDSSFRFERGADPNNTVYVLKRAALLIKELAGGEIEGDIRDFYPNPMEKPRVELAFTKINALIGKEIEKETIKNILESLEIEIENETDLSLTLRIPTYRVDVLRDVDVIEEILRIYGYNNVEISDSLKSNLSYQTPTDRKHALQTLISEQLTASGFSEIMNNSLTKKSYYENGETFPIQHCVPLLNLLSNDLGVMRQTLLFGGLESIAHNRNRKNSDLRFYEFGNCYFYNEEKKRDEKPLAPFIETAHLALWICGKRNAKSWAKAEANSSVFELKAFVENILTRLGMSDTALFLENVSNDIFATAVRIRTRNRHIGTWGIVQKKMLKTFDIDTDVFFAEINWDALVKETEKQSVQFAEIPKFPAVSRDLALLIDKKITFSDIKQIARKSEKKLLTEIGK
jgi:phenylalanyl-tRNA synthetase beta chain